MTDRTYNVLFLCTGNSARSIMAERILAKDGAGRFRAFSAGSHPKDEVNPLAIETLKKLGYPTHGVRSKSWDEFENRGAPHLDFVITVCDNAAGEVCPIWPGHPVRAHWGIEDPAAVQGTLEEKLEAFAQAARYLHDRVSLLVAVSDERLEADAAQSLQSIGRGAGASPGARNPT
jgi:arsenate reductase